MYSVQCTVHCTVASVRAARCRASRCWHVTRDVARCSTAAWSLQLHTAASRQINIEIYQDSFECDTRQCHCDKVMTEVLADRSAMQLWSSVRWLVDKFLIPVRRHRLQTTEWVLPGAGAGDTSVTADLVQTLDPASLLSGPRILSQVLESSNTGPGRRYLLTQALELLCSHLGCPKSLVQHFYPP